MRTFSPSDYSEAKDPPEDLQRLDRLEDEWKIKDDSPDPRGCTVVGADGDKLGEIEDLLVSPKHERAYFALVRSGDWLNNEHYLLPMSALDVKKDRTVGPFTREQFRGAPAWRTNRPDPAASHRYWVRERRV